MVPVTFKHLFHQLLHQQPAGIGWMLRIALDDNLAIALVFNTDKQMYIDFEMTFLLHSENQEQWMKILEKTSRK